MPLLPAKPCQAHAVQATPHGRPDQLPGQVNQAGMDQIGMEQNGVGGFRRLQDGAPVYLN
jgi:hypothetical protein